MGIDMRKNILFTLFGIVCLMMPVGANAEECSYATDHLWPSNKDAPVLDQNMIVCSDKKIFYCNGERKGKIFYGNVKQNIPSGPFNVTSSDEKYLLRCDGIYWQYVTQDKRSCCDDCSLIEFEVNTCNCSVYVSDQYGWSLNKCGSNVPDIPSNWEYKECCDSITATDYSVDGKTVYECDDGNYWTYTKCATPPNGKYKECCSGSSVSTWSKYQGKTVYTCGGYWSYNICGIADLTYKECCDSITATDHSVDGKTVYECDDGNYWTYEQCESMEDCSDSICTDATTSGTLTTLPWNATMTTQILEPNN
jgi:hypothetical protein